MNEKKKPILGQEAVTDARTLGTPRMLILGLQHLFAMFGATVLVPILVQGYGLPLSIQTTLLMAGLGTLLFHVCTKFKVPAFLGSSFAYLGGFSTVASMPAYDGLDPELKLAYALGGIVIAGLLYLVLALLFKVLGAKTVMRYFPPIVTGPMIIMIGLNLSGSAITNASSCWWLALVAMAIIVVANIWGKGMVKIIPILLGVVGAYIVALIVGLTTGILAAVYHDRPLDQILMSLSALGISAPSFWVAIILQIYVGLRFDIFPVSGVKSPIGYVLPSAALGVRYAASIARITRASMLEVTGQDFVKTAYAKGLYSWRIILIHIFQNALVPIITVIGTDIGALLTGSMITENVFNIPGIGKLLIDAIHRRDIPLVQGGVIYVAAICVLIYFIVDILYAVINPNIRLTKGE